MDWRFCPHCETQLDAETFICPACRWDPLSTPQTEERGPELSLMERYRGTQYDPGNWAGAAASATMTPPVSKTAHRVRTIVAVAIIAIIGAYGSMLVYTDMQSHQDQPASALHR